MTRDLPHLDDGLHPETLAQLRAVGLVPNRPIIAVDVDEVLVVFVDHLIRFIGTLGYEMRLERYELEGSMFKAGSDQPLPFDACIDLINRFFVDQCAVQEAIPGGAAALERLSAAAQIIILTNVPRHATEARRVNLKSLGMDWPLVVNSEGKGRAVAWLAARLDPGVEIAFVDDSVRQIESVAKHAPEAIRLHFAWAPFIRRLFPSCTAATAQVVDWTSAEALLRARLTV